MSKYIPFSNIWATKGLIEITFCTNIKISVTISEALEAIESIYLLTLGQKSMLEPNLWWSRIKILLTFVLFIQSLLSVLSNWELSNKNTKVDSSVILFATWGLIKISSSLGIIFSIAASVVESWVTEQIYASLLYSLAKAQIPNDEPIASKSAFEWP